VSCTWYKNIFLHCWCLNPAVCAWHVQTTGPKTPAMSTHIIEFPLRFLEACLTSQNFSHPLHYYLSTTMFRSEFLTLLKYSHFVKFTSTFLRGYLFTLLTAYVGVLLISSIWGKNSVSVVSAELLLQMNLQLTDRIPWENFSFWATTVLTLAATCTHVDSVVKCSLSCAVRSYV
jgi:hypothetical protein